jgi:hypothetical protein
MLRNSAVGYSAVLRFAVQPRCQAIRVSGVSLWPGGPTVGLEAYGLEAVSERFQDSV